MNLVAEAKLPIALDKLPEAITQFVDFARSRCVADGATSIHIFLNETGCKATRALAGACPADYKAFSEGPLLDRRKLLTASEFLTRTEKLRPSDSGCDASLTEFLSFAQGLEIIEKIAQTLPPSGRGVAMMLRVERAKLRDAPQPIVADLTFSRWRSGSRRKEATLRVSCPAQNKNDATAKQALSAVTELLNLKFSKPSFQPPLGRDAVQPDLDTLWPAHKAFQAAFDLATLDVERQGMTLDSVPLLFPRFDAFGKRIADTQNRIAEKIDLVAALKQLVHERFAGYDFEGSDAEAVIFRKSLTASLDGVLTFERFHHHGLGKSFTLNYGIRFPADSQLQSAPIAQLFHDSVFTLFHRDREQPAWAYSTSPELQQVLAGCHTVLSGVLPPLENRLAEMLSPLPKELPPSIESLGSLTAQEAYARALPVAQAWAKDAELVSVASLQFAGPPMATGVVQELRRAAIGQDGRLQPHGGWSVSFRSSALDMHVLVSVPHTGVIRWARFGYPLKDWQPASLRSQDWLDSPAVAQTANEALQPHLAGSDYQLMSRSYRLGADPPRYQKIVWEVTAVLAGKGRYEWKHVRLLFDPWNGKLLETVTQP